ncbi:hypothetical protein GCM10009836_45250 [Pseudonocardia ailaonensis]|uniref:Sulfatase-modifying factor enzyme-like domain-containing protein n=1 Tax=Pseudonocardia ailaonensis TaxID=367279 RepID=A0ABN2NBP4_9PSEU
MAVRARRELGAPRGVLTEVVGRELHPITHLCWEDVVANAEWAGKDLPTEAEWEFAARGGLDGALYAWADQLAPYGSQLANFWIGEFPLAEPQAPGGAADHAGAHLPGQRLRPVRPGGQRLGVDVGLERVAVPAEVRLQEHGLGPSDQQPELDLAVRRPEVSDDPLAAPGHVIRDLHRGSATRPRSSTTTTGSFSTTPSNAATPPTPHSSSPRSPGHRQNRAPTPNGYR